METRDLIPVQIICKHYKVPIAFISTLQEFQLIELTVENNVFFIHKTQLKEVEKMARLHYDLDINIEGIDAIYNLINQVESLQEEIKSLKNKLSRFES